MWMTDICSVFARRTTQPVSLAAALPEATVVAVDTPEALAETQRIVGGAGLSDRYTWHPGAFPQLDYGRVRHDAIVLNEICHTLREE
jgi:hypothetical protein